MFYYLTSNQIPAMNANSIQIASTCEALEKELGERFLFISPLNPKNKNTKCRYWVREACFFSRRSFRYIEFMLRMFFKIKCDQETVIFTRDILMAYLFAMKGVRVCYESHSKPSFIANFVLHRAVKYSNFSLAAISSALSHYLVGQYSLDERRVLVVHDGVFVTDYETSSTKLNTIRAEFPIPETSKVILHTGSLYPGRGAELFLTILKNFPEVCIVHIGGSEKFLSEIKKDLAGYNFFAKSHIERKDLVKFQRSCDVLLFPMLRVTPTYWCCSPMKLFEYMASKKPIVASKIGSISEILTEDDAYLFEPEELSSLLRAVKSALYDHRRDEKADRCFKLAKEKFCWSIRATEILKFLNVNLLGVKPEFRHSPFDGEVGVR